MKPEVYKKNFLILSTFVVAIILAVGVITYARGYRFNSESNKITANGIFVIKSYPDSAEVFLDGELTTATNATIDLEPATYDVRIQKEGYHTWEKRIDITEEEVTEATAHLFKSTPSLTATTFSSATNPTPSHDFTKLAYAVLPSNLDGNGSAEKAGLWVIETINLPIGFSKDPRQIADGDLTDATWEWSPNGQEILLTTKTGVYLLDVSNFTTQNQRVNITSTVDTVREEWEIEGTKKLESKLKKIPEPLADYLANNARAVVFSPDEELVLYTADASIALEKGLIDSLPGSSSQKEERDIVPNHTYVYDIKEDRNFLIMDNSDSLVIDDSQLEGATRRLVWFPTSRHLILAEPNKIIIMDHDGTNRVEVYQGSFVSPHAFPTVGTDKLIILTNLGADSTPENLYSLSLK